MAWEETQDLPDFELNGEELPHTVSATLKEEEEGACCLPPGDLLRRIPSLEKINNLHRFICLSIFSTMAMC